MSDIVIYFDGACEPVNPGGWGTYGYVLLRGGETLAEGCGCIGRGPGITNNVAEYRALIAGLSRLRELQIDGEVDRGSVVCRGDSRLVVEQVRGTWRCNKPHLDELRSVARELMGEVGAAVSLEWVPREQNERADALSRKAYVERDK